MEKKIKAAELEKLLNSKHEELREYMKTKDRKFLVETLDTHPTYISGFIHGMRSFGYRKLIECCKRLDL